MDILQNNCLFAVFFWFTCYGITVPDLMFYSLFLWIILIKWQEYRNTPKVPEIPQTLGDRMKSYEKSVDVTIDDDSWVVVRLDLRSGGKFVKHHRYTPFDNRFSFAMAKVMKELVSEFRCLVGYTQSDEISLVFPNLKENQTRFFGGRVQKWASVMASSASVRFAKHTSTDCVPQFDARVIELPSPEEAYNCLLFRARDCRRNSISMHARQYFSAKQLLNKRCNDMLKMCNENPWENIKSYDRFGWWYKPTQGLTTFEMKGFDLDIFEWITEKDMVLATESLDLLICPKPIRQRTDSIGNTPNECNPIDIIRSIKD